MLKSIGWQGEKGKGKYHVSEAGARNSEAAFQLWQGLFGALQSPHSFWSPVICHTL